MSAKIQICFFLIFLSHCSACNMDVKLSCRAGSFTDVVEMDNLGAATFIFKDFDFQPNEIYYDIGGEEIVFFIGKNIDNICPEKEPEITYNIETSNLEQENPITIQAVATWRVNHPNGASHSTQLLQISPESIPPSTIYKDSMSVNVNELFMDREAKMDVYFRIIFHSSGKFADDRLYLIQHIQSLNITSIGDKYL